jgi:hypothetical protein
VQNAASASETTPIHFATRRRLELRVSDAPANARGR